jgi:hypothetical protein
LFEFIGHLIGIVAVRLVLLGNLALELVALTLEIELHSLLVVRLESREVVDILEEVVVDLLVSDHSLLAWSEFGTVGAESQDGCDCSGMVARILEDFFAAAVMTGCVITDDASTRDNGIDSAARKNRGGYMKRKENKAVGVRSTGFTFLFVLQ